MRKFIIISLCLVFLVACNETEVKVENTSEQTETQSVSNTVTSEEKIEPVKLEAQDEQEYDEAKTYTLSELKEDYDAFVTAFITAAEVSDGQTGDVKKLLEDARSKIIRDGMTDGEFQLVLRELISNLNNNDTKLAPPRSKEYFIGKNKKLFPVELFFMNGGVYINENSEDGSLLVEDRVISINSVDIEKITEELSTLTSYNKNSFALDNNLSREFKLLYFEKYGESDSFKIEVDSNGTHKTVEIPAVNFEGIALSEIAKDAGTTTEDVVYENTEYSENKVSYLKIGTVKTEDSNKFFEQLDEAINVINDYDPVGVILDFSNNRTTNPEIIRDILSRFIKDDTTFYDFGEGNLMEPVKKAEITIAKDYAVMFDNRSSSQVNQLVMTLSRSSGHKSAGINTSSATISYNDFEELELPNTGIIFKYPKSILNVLGEVELFEIGVSPSEYKSDIVFSGRKASVIELLYKSFCSV